MKCAVDGLLETMSSTSSPSSIPRPAASLWPSTTLAPASCTCGRKMNPPPCAGGRIVQPVNARATRSEEHTSELQSQFHLVCRLLLEKKKKNTKKTRSLII